MPGVVILCRVKLKLKVSRMLFSVVIPLLTPTWWFGTPLELPTILA